MAGYGLKVHESRRVCVQAEYTGGYGLMGLGFRIFLPWNEDDLGIARLLTKLSRL
jgi:hypothetical protein